MPINKPVQVRMYNLYGSAVFKQLYSNAASPLIIQNKELTKISSGVYFLSVSADQKLHGIFIVGIIAVLIT